MRPIDADDLKKSLNNYVFNDPTCPMHIAATVDQYIDFAPTVGGWISCSERMPREYDTVLIAILSKNGYDEPAYYVTIGCVKNKTEFDCYVGDICDGEKVTHWMPLPEPPGGDEK